MPSVTVDGVRLECRRIEATHAGNPAIVMLHEGLGSIAVWKDFPHALARTTGRAVIAYSRRGHGGSDPLSGPRSVGYMHEEALEVLPRLLGHNGAGRANRAGCGPSDAA